ncbi:MAG: hypothetical protein ACREO3_08435 [Arenimonas sp.]
MRSSPFWYATLVGGGIAGALDISYAICFSIFRGGTAQHLLQIVATGVLGTLAFERGWSSAALGLALHFAMSFVFAAFFFLVADRRPGLALRPWISGPLYGLGVFLVMNLVVLPLSAFPYPVKFTGLGPATNLLSHLFFFGLPIALATRRALGLR